MDITALVTTWINNNAVGRLAQYNVPAICTMVQRWADEDTNGVVSALPADEVSAIVESYRGVAVK